METGRGRGIFGRLFLILRGGSRALSAPRELPLVRIGHAASPRARKPHTLYFGNRCGNRIGNWCASQGFRSSVASGAEAPESEGRDLAISVSMSGPVRGKSWDFLIFPDDRNLGLRMTGEERVKGTGGS